MGEFKEWRCNECGQEVFAAEKPNSIRWTDGHVCSFSEYEEPCFSELGPARHMDKKKLGDTIKHWPDVWRKEGWQRKTIRLGYKKDGILRLKEIIESDNSSLKNLNNNIDLSPE